MRQQACARDNEELELGVRCIAAGIYDDTGKLVAGLSLSAPADRLQDAWLGQLSQTALVISECSVFVRKRPHDHSRGQHKLGPQRLFLRHSIVDIQYKKASHLRGFFLSRPIRKPAGRTVPRQVPGRRHPRW